MKLAGFNLGVAAFFGLLLAGESGFVSAWTTRNFCPAKQDIQLEICSAQASRDDRAPLRLTHLNLAIQNCAAGLDIK